MYRNTTRLKRSDQFKCSIMEGDKCLKGAGALGHSRMRDQHGKSHRRRGLKGIGVLAPFTNDRFSRDGIPVWTNSYASAPGETINFNAMRRTLYLKTHIVLSINQACYCAYQAVAAEIRFARGIWLEGFKYVPYPRVEIAPFTRQVGGVLCPRKILKTDWWWGGQGPRSMNRLIVGVSDMLQRSRKVLLSQIREWCFQPHTVAETSFLGMAQYIVLCWIVRKILNASFMEPICGILAEAERPSRTLKTSPDIRLAKIHEPSFLQRYLLAPFTGRCKDISVNSVLL